MKMLRTFAPCSEIAREKSRSALEDGTSLCRNTFSKFKHLRRKENTMENNETAAGALVPPILPASATEQQRAAFEEADKLYTRALLNKKTSSLTSEEQRFLGRGIAAWLRENQ
jgi:hypothetical protein